MHGAYTVARRSFPCSKAYAHSTGAAQYDAHVSNRLCRQLDIVQSCYANRLLQLEAVPIWLAY